MRGGVRVWRRGSAGRGVAAALAYAFEGKCDASTPDVDQVSGIENAARYAGDTVRRVVCRQGELVQDSLGPEQLRSWIDGIDPLTGEQRGRQDSSPQANLLFDSTINAPKSFSIAAMLSPELAAEFSRLQDRLRDRAIQTWQSELNARRGTMGRTIERLTQIEVVELEHARSRSLDPHAHRHLWLNAKVQGADGKWSNLDSAVMMKFQPVINGEGELAARTDPEWRAALARNGFTLNEAGEIAELAHLVRPLSRRANQIEANRATLLDQWAEAHPGQEPGPHDLAAIDARAWALGRPNKPGELDEMEWATQVRSELADLDPQLGRRLVDREPSPMTGTTVADLDRDLLAAEAAAWADARSARSNDRFSLFDLRAGAAYMVAASGVIADRAHLSELLEDVTERALSVHAVALTDAEWVPGHVKAYRSTSTVQIKHDVEIQYTDLAYDGPSAEAADVDAAAAAVTELPLDAGQRDAAALIAGRAGLVVVTGPAGTGKTTILQTAKQILDGQGRRMLVVAPSKKAANVARAATGAQAGSIHSLLRAYGWRWRDTTTGPEWTLLQPGDVDPDSEMIYAGVPPEFALQRGDRIVVDEAGMMDLHTAYAIGRIANSTGAGVALVGDHLQLNPVGHAGAMALARRLSPATSELTAVHRFRTADNEPDDAYAALTLRMREPEGADDALAIATALEERGLIVTASDDQAAAAMMVNAWFDAHGRGRSIAITTSTNDEAQHVNEEIQRRRLDRGQLDDRARAYGQHAQALYVGDVIQTRRNDAVNDVANRDDWTITAIHADGDVRATRRGDLSDKTVTLTRDYLAEHAHLAYASTAHGIQGVTQDEAVTGPDVTGAGLYVGQTRGKLSNRVVVIAPSTTEAKKVVAEALRRGRPEDTLEDSRQAVAEEILKSAKPAPVVADWTDRAARPFGAEPNVTGRLKTARRAAELLRPAAEAESEHTAAATEKLRRQEAQIAALEREAAIRAELSTDRAAAEQHQRRAREQARRPASQGPADPSRTGPAVAGPEHGDTGISR